MNEDIPGSKPDCVKFKTARNSCNPLNPVYKLQSFEVIPAPIPKFIRDAFDCADIAGSRPKQKK